MKLVEARQGFRTLALSLVVAASFSVYSCGGDRFTLQPNETGTSSGGSGGGPCREALDCDDGDACTVDLCLIDGTCAYSEKCSGTQICCAGQCKACCGDSDCTDSVDCTGDTCDAGVCVFSPRDENCGDDEYCSVSADCVPRQPCVLDSDCDDGNPCTTEACGDGLCEFQPCTAGELCCPASGGCIVGECCNDADCNDTHSCTSDVCSQGQCSHQPVACPEGTQCHEASGSSVCTECESSADCDDGIACTDNRCLGGICQFPDACTEPLVCDAEQGKCTAAPGCEDATDCNDNNPCSVETCDLATCSYQYCAEQGQLCCANGCVPECCDASDCDDGIACTKNECMGDGSCKFTPQNAPCNLNRSDSARERTCDPKRGCIECVTGDDCKDLVSSPCQSPVCENGTCGVSLGCGLLQTCCPEGCVLGSKCSGQAQ